jgi:ABC-type branched-subunit amino acid transport system ATPase component
MAERLKAPPAAGIPVLQIAGLNVFYGRSHAVQGVDLTLQHGVLSVVGRNGMGKTTMCKAIMGLVPIASGSIRFFGEEIAGRSPAEVARLGIGYVPQGRRLWRSLTVDEHLRLMQRGKRGAWTPERIYEVFPRLAERRNNGGGQLSGGEQQMLAISRALLLNPRLLIMDEPTEGLAPVIVAHVEEMLVRLAEQGDVAILVIEQNIGVATQMSDPVAIMVNGRINRIIASATLAGDRDLQQRLLGVGRHGHDETDAASEAAPAAGTARPAAPALAGPTRVYISNPVIPNRWSQAVPAARIEAQARTISRPTLATRDGQPVGAIRPLAAAASSEPYVVIAGTLDTKGEELRFIRDLIRTEGLRTRLVDLSTSGRSAGGDVTPQEIALASPKGSAGISSGDRGTAVAAMTEAFKAWLPRQQGLLGIISAGGSGATAMVTPAMQALPVGLPKLMISTMASGDVRAYVGATDIAMLHAVTDVQGVNRVSRLVLGNGAHAIAAMAKARLAELKSEPSRRREAEKPLVGLTMFGVTTPCVQQVAKLLADEWEPLVFHATGTGGQLDGEAGRVRPCRCGDRRLDHRDLRPADGRFPAGDRGPLRRDHPHPHPLCRLGRRARHGQLLRAGNGAGALSRPPALSAQPADHADADHGGRECPHGPLDRRAAEPDGRAGPLPDPRARRFRAGCARPGLPRPRSRCRPVPGAGADRAHRPEPAADPPAAPHQRPRLRRRFGAAVPHAARRPAT